MDCPHCQTPNPASAARCLKCDTPFPMDQPTLNDRLDPSATLDGEFAKDWSAAVTSPDQADGSASKFFLKPGSLVAHRYEIHECLGTGGMGSVYKARDRELDRFVALKVIRPDLAGDSEILRRFKQELILARQVTHKNVIRIFDLGEDNKLKFITMEYIDGRNLKSLVVEKGKLSYQETVGIMQQVSLALEAAHAEGVIHRDLKPHNIMLDSHGKVSVMDFGIARSMAPGGMTITGALLGTPEYMSPEQVRGEHVDGRSDLFSLGLILFELLTGKKPYDSDTAESSMFKRTAVRALSAVVADPNVPPLLNEIVAKCLERDPKERYQTARQLWDDLEKWNQGAGLPPWTLVQRRFQRFATTRSVVLAASLLLILAVSAFGYRQWRASGARVNPSAKTAVAAQAMAVFPFRNASGDQKLDWLGSSMADMLTEDLGQSVALRTVSATRVNQILQDLRIDPEARLDARTVERLAEYSNANLIVVGQFLKFGDQVQIELTLQDIKTGRNSAFKKVAAEEKDVLQSIDGLAKEIRGNLSLSSSAIQELESQAIKPSSNSLEALRHYDQGLQAARKGNNLAAIKEFTTSTAADPNFALAFSKLGETYAKLGQDNDSEVASLKAVELSQTLPPQEKYLIAASHSRIMKEYPKAIASYEELAKVRPGDTDTLFDLATLYENSANYEKARQYYLKVRELDPKRVDALLALGRVEIESGTSQNGLDYLSSALNLAIQFNQDEPRADILQAMGVAYQDLNRLREALRSFQDSLEIKQRLGLKNGAAESLSAIAQVQLALGKPDLALRGYNDALKLLRETGDKAGVAGVLNDLGNFYNDRGESGKALALFKECLQIQTELGNEASQGMALNNIGNTYLAQADYADAHTYFEQALQHREKSQNSTDIAETLHNLAETSANLGLFDQAIDHYMHALNLRRGLDDKRGAAIETYSMGVVFGMRSRYGASLSSTEEALKTFRALGEKSFWMALILGGYGRVLAQVGQTDESQKNLNEALGIASELKNQILIAQIKGFQGDASFYHGDYKTAYSLYQEARNAGVHTSDHQLDLVTKMNLARVAVEEGRPQTAIATLQSVRDSANAAGIKYLALQCSVALSKALILSKRYPQAQAELQRALVAGEKLGTSELVAQSHDLLARVADANGNASESQHQHLEALTILDGIQKESHLDLRGRSDFTQILTAKR